MSQSSKTLKQVGSLELTNLINPKSVVTQLTAITTGVSITTQLGQIVTVAATTATSSSSVFTVSNPSLTASSIVFASINNYAGAGRPTVSINSITHGSFIMSVNNNSATVALNAALTIGYNIL